LSRRFTISVLHLARVLPLVFFIALPSSSCRNVPDPDDDATSADDDLDDDSCDDDDADDDTGSLDDDDSSAVLTPLLITYSCLSDGGDGSVRPWYFFDPWSWIEVEAEQLRFEESGHVARSMDAWDLSCPGQVWNWDVEGDQFPTEPGWFVSATVDLEVFHGIERLVIWLPHLDPGHEYFCEIEPDAQLQVRGGDDPNSLGEWCPLDLGPTDEYPNEICYKQWRREGDQPPWAGRYLQFRVDLTSHEDIGYVQAALPLYVEYMTSVSYYYWVVNKVLTEP